MSVRELCASCSEQADRQAEQMKPRTLREGVAMIAKQAAFVPVHNRPLPDVRMGDIVRVVLVAGAVEDLGFCDNVDCSNYRGIA